MEPDLTDLDECLKSMGVDGYLLDADSESSDQYYLSGFDAPDPFVTLYDGETHLLVSGLEYGRAGARSRAETVSRHATYRPDEDEGGRSASHRTLSAFLAAHGVGSVAVPERFPVGTADGLRRQDVSVTVDGEETVTDIRARKTPEEIEHIRAAQAANQNAMARAEELIREAEVGEEGELRDDGGTLTSERVAREIEIALLERGYALDETIVAGGAQAADPHESGSGPLHANEAIVIDIFPRGKVSKYNGDMTRTFLKGEPSAELARWYDLTHQAYRAALDALGPGVTGKAVHDVVCDVYENAGEATLRSDPETETGYIHSTGHGVGLDVHEMPTLSPRGEELQPGHVVSVEPGLYHPEVGGVRIEDLVVVTEEGYENLTEYPIELVVD